MKEGMNDKTEHYTEGRRWSYLRDAWILVESWNDREELASLRARIAELEAASPSSKSTKEAPDLWIIFDSQGPYDFRDSEEQAQRFCTHYNKREVDPLKPYTYRRYVASSSIKEDGERAEGVNRA